MERPKPCSWRPAEAHAAGKAIDSAPSARFKRPQAGPAGARITYAQGRGFRLDPLPVPRPAKRPPAPGGKLLARPAAGSGGVACAPAAGRGRRSCRRAGPRGGSSLSGATARLSGPRRAHRYSQGCRSVPAGELKAPTRSEAARLRSTRTAAGPGLPQPLRIPAVHRGHTRGAKPLPGAVSPHCDSMPQNRSDLTRFGGRASLPWPQGSGRGWAA
jgi:hypothetical protein